MAKWWCTNCKGEREHRYSFCHNSCQGNCYHTCDSCGKESLACILPSTTTTNQQMIIREMIATAQRRARDYNLTGEVEVTRTTGDNAYDRNSFQCQVLVYNTQNGKFTHDFVAPANR